jgi:hypothetical protein
LTERIKLFLHSCISRLIWSKDFRVYKKFSILKMLTKNFLKKKERETRLSRRIKKRLKTER